MATAARTPPGTTAERVEALSELAGRDPLAAQDAAWGWFERLGRRAAADRAAGAADLAELFGCGRVPRGLDGPTEGILVAPLIQPLADRALRAGVALWMPWLGKSLYAADSRGDNRLVPGARWPMKLLWPRYEARDAGDVLLGFDFETRVERGGVEPVVEVLVIDYAPVERNPRFIIRSIRDELTEIVPGAWLGRILWRRRGGGYANIGCFALRTPVGS